MSLNEFILGSYRTLIKESKMLLLEKQPRADYQELLELILLILGEKTIHCKKLTFKKPGAVHKARWMSKVLYSLKIWMFQSHRRPMYSSNRYCSLHTVSLFQGLV